MTAARATEGPARGAQEAAAQGRPPDGIGRAVAAVGAALASHAGGLELAGVGEDGAVTVRFTGMCTGCPYRPLTMAATVRPALLAVGGVTDVQAVGSRISAEAQRRLAGYLEDSAGPPARPAAPLA